MTLLQTSTECKQTYFTLFKQPPCKINNKIKTHSVNRLNLVNN